MKRRIIFLAMLLACASLQALLFSLNSAHWISITVTPKYLDDWMMMRSLPIPFPDVMAPEIPEGSTNVLSLGRFGKECLVVLPDEDPPTNVNGQAFTRCVDFVLTKLPNSSAIKESALTSAQLTNNLIVFGTNSQIAAQLVSGGSSAFLSGTANYGYHIKMFDNPYRSDRKVVLALGKDWLGASSAATIMYFSICRQDTDSGTVQGWPVSWPTNAAFWLPFEAAYTNNANRVVLPDPLPDMPPVPAIPCGLRIWGGPIPTLESWQRLLREAKKMNINSVIVQSGGWVDMRNPEILYPAMLDLAQAEGIYVTMYVGNETAKSHYPVAWTNSNHTRIITAIKNHPALLHFALYNQLTRLENMTADEIQTLDGQIAYLSTNTDKSIDVEVCGDQNNHEFAAEKIALMEHLRDRGVKIISTDVAPVGGWSATHDHTIWETRIERILDLGLTPMCCIQAHIPFEGPAIPAEADVFLQFWLNVAAGTRGFYYEAAYVYNHYSIRGLLSWKLKPLPDGRAGAAAATMGYLPALTNMLVNSQKVDDPVSASALTIETANPDNVLMRMRTDGIRSWLFLINRDTANPVEFTLKRTVAESLYLREVAPGSSSRLITETGDRLSLPPGQGVCFEMD